MRETIASRAILIFWKEPMMCILLEEYDSQCMIKRPRAISSRVCKDDTRPAGILNGKLCFAVFAGDTTDSPREMVALERFDIFDFKGVEI